MKPIKLTMQAFGPFAKTEVIEFEKLGQNPLFLINGPTGSGKTSILDAICFALYGETTGNERQGMQMRCDLAPAELLTEIILEFSLHDKTYRVTRSPEQAAPKARGEGMTVRKHTAALYEITAEEKLITSKTTQVKTEITAIIGLNETQFRQVMVLPQGKFRELLLASSKEREEIFGQLFQTDIYKKIEFALKDKASAISKAKNDFDNQIRGALQVAEAGSEQELNQQRENQAAELAAAQQLEQQALATLNKAKAELQNAQALNNEFAKLAHAQAALQQHDAKREQVQQLQTQLESASNAAKIELPYANRVNAGKQVNEFRQTMITLEQQQQTTNRDLQIKQQAYDEAKAKAEGIPALTETQYRLETIKTRLVEKEALECKLRKGQLQQKQDEQTLANYLAHKEKLTQEAQSGQKALDNARLEVAQTGQVEADISRLQRLSRDLTRLKGLKDELSQLTAATSGKKERVAKAKQAYERARKVADEQEMHWHSGQAALLAQKLQAGEACPVCGSCEHPVPAQFVDQQVSKEQVQAARESERQAQQELNHASNQFDQHSALVTQTQRQLELFTEELGEKASVSPAKVEQDLQVLTARLQQLSGVDLAKMEQSVAELNQRCERGESKIRELQNQMAANASLLDANQQQLTTLNASLDQQYPTLGAVEKEIANIKHSADVIQKSLESAQGQLQQATLAHANVQSQLATNQQLLTAAEEKLHIAQSDWQQALESSHFADEQQYLDSKRTAEQIQALQQEIDAYQHALVKLQQTFTDLQHALQDAEKPDLDELNANLNTCQAVYTEKRTHLDGIRSMFERLEKVSRDIAQLHDKNAKLEQEYQVYGTLYDVASGKTGSRVSLHRFVLGVLLDDVLIQASQRLSLMSKGRYMLARKTDGFKGAAGRGLDLVVEDSYSGKMRDVATLSGGESFMAALALALGLSDVVQSYSGGIRLDTLFIDEGFGSLDPESLDLAIQTLVDLQQTGRMIGVISHVSELKEQMAARIDVEPSRLGSTVRVRSPLADPVV